MSNFAALIPVANLLDANAALAAQGFGDANFSVAAFSSPSPQFAVLHSWHDAVFKAAVSALPQVTILDGVEGTSPVVLASSVSATVGAQWVGDTPELVGVVTPGLYHEGIDFWWVLQQYDTAVWPDPMQVPALVRRARIPGTITPWQQPLDQYDAYKLVNPFTSAPDQCTFNGQIWYVSQADGVGNNIWQPGVFGWTVLGTPPQDYITYNGDPVFYAGQGVTNG